MGAVLSFGLIHVVHLVGLAAAPTALAAAVSFVCHIH